MFVGRTRELQELTAEISNWGKKTAVLIYGKRRVGKSTLIKEAAKNFDGVVINHLCIQSTFEGNLDLVYRSVSDALSLPKMRFDSLFEMMDFLKTLDKRILFIIDEYPYLKQTKKKNEVDSYMQTVVDRLPENVKLVLCGSYITIMKELLAEDNPLFGRFSLIQHIRDFDYFDASQFYPELSVRDKVAYYAVFGGSPYVLENLDIKATMQENIERLLLPETGLIRSHIENVMLREIRRLLAELGVVTRRRKPLSHHDILYILQNEAYKGDKLLQRQPPKDFITRKPDKTKPYKSYYLENDHEPIVEPEVWDAVQERIKQTMDLKEAVGHLGGRPHFLYGKVFCADCGSPMTRRTFTGYKRVKYKAWVCRDRNLGRNGNGCQMRIVKEDELLEEICRQTGWEEVTEEKVVDIDRVEIREDGVEVVQRKFTV